MLQSIRIGLLAQCAGINAQATTIQGTIVNSFAGNNFEAISLGVPLRGELLVSWQDYLNNGTRCLEMAERAAEGALQEIPFEVASEWLKLAQESRKPSWTPEPTVAGRVIH